MDQVVLVDSFPPLWRAATAVGPAAVGATGALAAVRDGDVVEMDGSTGEIRALEPGDTAPGRGAPAGQ